MNCKDRILSRTFHRTFVCMHQLARKVATIPLRSCWSNSRPTGHFRRNGRHTALLLHKQCPGYPLPQLGERKIEEPCGKESPKPTTEAGYFPPPSCLPFFAKRLFSVCAFDKLLLMTTWHSRSHAVEAKYVLPKKKLVVCRPFAAQEPTRFWAKLERHGPCFQLTRCVCHNLDDLLDLLCRCTSCHELLRYTVAAFALHRENRLEH